MSASLPVAPHPQINILLFELKAFLAELLSSLIESIKESTPFLGSYEQSLIAESFILKFDEEKEVEGVEHILKLTEEEVLEQMHGSPELKGLDEYIASFCALGNKSQSQEIIKKHLKTRK